MRNGSPGTVTNGILTRMRLRISLLSTDLMYLLVESAIDSFTKDVLDPWFRVVAS